MKPPASNMSVELFIYDVFCELRSFYNQVHFSLRVVNTITDLLQKRSQNSPRVSQLAAIAERKTTRAFQALADLWVYFAHTYYPAEDNSPEALKESMRATLGKRREILLANFVGPMRAKHKQLKNELCGIEAVCEDILQANCTNLQDFSSHVEIRALSHEAANIIGKSKNRFDWFFEYVEELAKDNKHFTLVWNGNIHKPPSQ